MTIKQEIAELRAMVEALEAKYETMRLATLEWGKDVENLQRWSDQHLLRIERLETGATCPHIISSHGGTSYCDLALQTAAAQLDPIDEEENDRRFKAAMAAIDRYTIEQPVTDHRLISPAAQAVLDAVIDQWGADRRPIASPLAAAALRAVADRMTGLIPDVHTGGFALGVEASAAFAESLAAELENLNG